MITNTQDLVLKCMNRCGQKDNPTMGNLQTVKALTQELGTKKLALLSGNGVVPSVRHTSKLENGEDLCLSLFELL